ncbi:uvrD/REP helicase N-terminal domain protein, partial [Vibrio parahaemolyticus V-223/04]
TLGQQRKLQDTIIQTSWRNSRKTSCWKKHRKAVRRSTRYLKPLKHFLLTQSA